MKLSTRNIIKGKVTAIKEGQVIANVKVDIGGGNTLHIHNYGGSSQGIGTQGRGQCQRPNQGEQRYVGQRLRTGPNHESFTVHRQRSSPSTGLADSAHREKMRLSEKTVELIMFLTLIVCLALVIIFAR